MYVCMKYNKTVSLDLELREDLEKINGSELINNLLKEYFNESGSMKKEELKKKLVDLKEEDKKIINDMEKIRNQLEKIEADEKRVKAIFKNIPTDIIEDFKFYPKMTETTLLTRYAEIYSKRYEITFDEIKKAWDEWKGTNAKL